MKKMDETESFCALLESLKHKLSKHASIAFMCNTLKIENLRSKECPQTSWENKA